ncbi:hypothetical protein BC826DRAFT_154798 [Russula brevipes]|nr:hypothetical protein BC826DRAFT_154798 [Russula brevipes]
MLVLLPSASTVLICTLFAHSSGGSTQVRGHQYCSTVSLSRTQVPRNHQSLCVRHYTTEPHTAMIHDARDVFPDDSTTELSPSTGFTLQPIAPGLERDAVR